ncbi:MAG: CCA tRNA nucleotidyltransferase [Candidatus Poseidoniaceae archaeon]|nr:CCA tRNA nucleotidyltransferase [Candidatus Poseidoniaceae archaeon]
MDAQPDWPKPGVLSDVVAQQCPPIMTKWLQKLDADLLLILNTIAEAGGGVWIVGGAPRDVLLSIEVTDIDLAVDLDPEEMLKLFPNAIRTGIQFGTLTLRGGDSMYECTTLRTESQYVDGRRPQVVNWGTSLAQDLQRRDFTINAMAIDVSRMKLHDPHNGTLDLERGVLRAVGNASLRLSEDGLRIMRAYRFMDRDDAGIWFPDNNLALALSEKRRMLSNVASERIWNEFKKILTGSNVSTILEMMLKDEVLAMVLQTEWNLASPIFEAISEFTQNETDYLSVLAILLSETDTTIIPQLLNNLKLSKHERDSVIGKLSRMGHVPLNEIGKLRVHRHVLGKEAAMHLYLEYIIRKYSIRLTLGYSNDCTLEELDALMNNSAKLKPPSFGNKSILDGNILMKLTSINGGPKLGYMKSWLHRIQIERDIQTEQEMIQILSTIIWQNSDGEDWPKVQFPE